MLRLLAVVGVVSLACVTVFLWVCYGLAKGRDE